MTMMTDGHTSASQRGGKVLLVDDDRVQLKLAELRLRELGFDVETAGGADEAFAKLARMTPDVILSDVLMDDLDGFGLCRRVRQMPELAAVPVVLLSAHYDDVADRALASHVGASALVRRTPSFEAELAALEQTLAAGHPAPLSPAERAVYEEHLRTNAQQLTKLLAHAKRAEDRYRRLLEHANDAIMVTTLAGVIIEANGRWRDILGVPIEELLGRNIHEWSQEYPEGVRQGDEVLAAGGGRVGPIAIRRRDGRVVTMVFSLSITEIEGEPLVLSIATDVTKSLADEARHRSLVERIPDVLWMRTRSSDMTFFTPNAEKVLGESSAALAAAESLAPLARVHADDAELVEAAYRAYLADGTPFDMEYRYRRKDGRWLWLRNRSFPRPQDEGDIAGEGMLSDITERKRLEDDLRQSQKMEALGQLTGGIAHDFNNILATMLANADFLIEALPEGDPRAEDAQAIREAGERAVALTRHLLAFSRRQLLEPRVVDLNATVAGVQRMLRSIIRENITFTFAPCATLGTVRIDLGQLEQVIMNLVVNASDAMPAGGTLTIETEDCRAQNTVLLRVKDTGHGMDEATQRRIFEPFFTTKDKGRGTGLGLSTCYGIVQQSGGRIAVTSELGGGTTFTITLPRLDELPGSSSSSKEPSLGGKETILLVEDDVAVRTAVQRILTSQGYRVFPAQDGADAIRIGSLNADAIDLVVSDVIMPGVSGPQIVEKLRRRTPALRALFMSGYADPETLRSVVLDSSSPIVEKPFKPEKLLRTIRTELARR